MVQCCEWSVRALREGEGRKGEVGRNRWACGGALSHRGDFTSVNTIRLHKNCRVRSVLAKEAQHVWEPCSRRRQSRLEGCFS